MQRGLLSWLPKVVGCWLHSSRRIWGRMISLTGRWNVGFPNLYLYQQLRPRALIMMVCRFPSADLQMETLCSLSSGWRWMQSCTRPRKLPTTWPPVKVWICTACSTTTSSFASSFHNHTFLHPTEQSSCTHFLPRRWTMTSLPSITSTIPKFSSSASHRAYRDYRFFHVLLAIANPSPNLYYLGVANCYQTNQLLQLLLGTVEMREVKSLTWLVQHSTFTMRVSPLLYRGSVKRLIKASIGGHRQQNNFQSTKKKSPNPFFIVPKKTKILSTICFVCRVWVWKKRV